jgi:WD40 repeat protein
LLGVALIHRSDDVKVAFSSNGRYIATGGIDNQARVWNLPLEKARTPPCHIKARSVSLRLASTTPAGSRRMNRIFESGEFANQPRPKTSPCRARQEI